DGAGGEMGERGEDRTGADDHVVAQDRRQLRRTECQGVAKEEKRLPHRVDAFPLRCTVDCLDHLAVDGRVDRRAPCEAFLGRNAQEQRVQGTGGVITLSFIQADEVVRVALAQHVGAVAGYPRRRRGDRKPPIALQRELDYDWVFEGLRHLRRLSTGPAPRVPFWLDDICAARPHRLTSMPRSPSPWAPARRGWRRFLSRRFRTHSGLRVRPRSGTRLRRYRCAGSARRSCRRGSTQPRRQTCRLRYRYRSATPVLPSRLVR